MKALLLKDWYQIWNYMKIFLILIIGFDICAIWATGFFMLIFPGFYISLLVSSLVNYDERSGWTKYADTLPYSRKLIVSEKYVMLLFGMAANLLLSAITMTINLVLETGRITALEIPGVLMMILIASTVPSSLYMPLIFKFGTEKGRMLYLFMIAVNALGISALTAIPLSMQHGATATLPSVSGLAAAVVISFVLFAASWMLSVRFYQKREL